MPCPAYPYDQTQQVTVVTFLLYHLVQGKPPQSAGQQTRKSEPDAGKAPAAGKMKAKGGVHQKQNKPAAANGQQNSKKSNKGLSGKQAGSNKKAQR